MEQVYCFTSPFRNETRTPQSLSDLDKLKQMKRSQTPVKCCVCFKQRCQGSQVKDKTQRRGKSSAHLGQETKHSRFIFFPPTNVLLFHSYGFNIFFFKKNKLNDLASLLILHSHHIICSAFIKRSCSTVVSLMLLLPLSILQQPSHRNQLTCIPGLHTGGAWVEQQLCSDCGQHV